MEHSTYMEYSILDYALFQNKEVLHCLANKLSDVRYTHFASIEFSILKEYVLLNFYTNLLPLSFH